MTTRNSKRMSRARRQAAIRSRVKGTAMRPRLAVFRSSTHIYAQLIDDSSGKTLLSTSSKVAKLKGNKTEQAKQVGQKIAELAKSRKISTVSFDRGGFLYHGRVKALADGAREGGLAF